MPAAIRWPRLSSARDARSPRLVAAFCAVSEDRLKASAAACALAKKAAEAAKCRSSGPGSFHNAYLDALYQIQPADFTCGA